MLLEELGLPLALTGVETDAVLDAMYRDKKADDESINFVLLERLGEPRTGCDVEPSRLRGVVEMLAGGGNGRGG